MRLCEFSQQYYHGSFDHLPVGTVLTPWADYAITWGKTDFYHILEKYRPENKLAHKYAIFMVDNEDDVDIAGGGTEWLFTVEPIGKVERHDMNWGSEISMLVSDGYMVSHPKIQNAAEKYWSGVPHTDETVWEYLVPRARILKVEEY